MHLEPHACYRAMSAHDARFDGCFFVGVSSTGVYCRPVCRVKLPRLENCTFFGSAAAAEKSGYRPCLRCRPELAPGQARVDASLRLANAAASLMEDGLPDERGVSALSTRLGVTPRHLRRVFLTEFGVSPIAFLQTQRLLMAKRLLTDTPLPVTDVAFASGFNSLRRFNDLFRSRYNLIPRQLRKSGPGERHPDVLEFQVNYRPPYDWSAVLGFLGVRSIGGVEEVSASGYRRIVRILRDGVFHVGWMGAYPDQGSDALRIVVSGSLARVVPGILGRVKSLFDLSCDPVRIGEALGRLAGRRPGLRLPGAFDGFEVGVRAILGQQVSVAAARTLATRFAAAFGTPAASPFPALTTAFPAPGEVAALEAEDIARLGVMPARARTITGLAKAVAAGAVCLMPGADASAAVASLRAIPGIGEWTAQYIAMRALCWPDAFPHTDLGLMRALGEKNPRRVLAAAEAWRPWRAYAVMHFWTGGEMNV